MKVLAVPFLLTIIIPAVAPSPPPNTGNDNPTTQPIPTTQPLTTTQPAAPSNPHWNADGCSTCHGNNSEPLQAIERSRIDDLCVDCHNGRDAREEVHPVGRVFGGEDIVLPAGWPTSRSNNSSPDQGSNDTRPTRSKGSPTRSSPRTNRARSAAGRVTYAYIPPSSSVAARIQTSRRSHRLLRMEPLWHAGRNVESGTVRTPRTCRPRCGDRWSPAACEPRKAVPKPDRAAATARTRRSPHPGGFPARPVVAGGRNRSGR